MNNKYFSVGGFSANHPGGMGHPSTEIKVSVDPNSVGVNGRRRHIATCSCGATQIVLPYAKRR